MSRIRLYMIVISILSFFTGIEINGQYFNNYSQKDGLTGSNVTAVVQDQYGFIWIGTDNGLNRYDGYQFKQYRKIPGDSSSIYTNAITRLYVDGNNDLWVGTVIGISRYNREKDNFTNYLNGARANCFYIMDILSDSDDNLYAVCGNGGIMRYDEKTGRFITEAELGIYVIRMIMDDKNNFWIGNNDGLFYYNKNTHELINHYNSHKNESLPDDISVTCFFYEDHKLWIGTEKNGILRYDELTGEYELISNNNKYIFFIQRDNNGEIWIGDGHALHHFDEKNYGLNPVPIYKGDDSDRIELGAECFLNDLQGNIWIGLKYGGINQYTKKHNFENFSYHKNSIIPLTKGNITAMLIDSENHLWLGSFTSGIDVIDLENNTKKTYTYDPGNPGSIGPGTVHCIFEDSRKNIWIGTHQGGLQQYLKNSDSFVRYIHLPGNVKSISDNDVRCITEDDNHQLWVSAHGAGLSKFDPDTREFTNYLYTPNKEQSLTSEWLYDIQVDHNKNIWIASAFGLTRIDSSGLYHKYFSDPDDTTSLTHNFVNTLFEDSKKRLWVGTIEGLNLYIDEDDLFRQYKNPENRNNTIHSILEDHSGNLWLGTSEGLTRFNPQSEIFRNFDISDGLSSNEFFVNAACKDPQGRLLFGNVNGFTRFDPADIKVDSFKVPVFITEFKVFNKPVPIRKEVKKNFLKKNIQLLDEIVLDDHQNVLTFEYVALNFIEPEKNQYAYMLEGFDKDWNHIGTKREVTYTNLDPGEYVFKVKASNHDGIWNEQGAQVRLVILPPYWRTTWFKMTAVILTIILLCGAYFLRVRNIRQRNLILQKHVEERTMEITEMNKVLESRQRFIEDQTVELKQQRDVLYDVNVVKDRLFTIIAHDLKSPFNTLLGFTRLLHDNYPKFDENKKRSILKNIYETAERTYELLENLFKWARAQQGIIKFNPQDIDLIGLINCNIELVNKQAQVKKIRINFKDSPASVNIKIDPDLINTVIRNILSNAIKFTPDKGHIDIKVEVKSNKVICGIKDTGVGISRENLDKLFKKECHYVATGTKNEKGTGLGLLMCKDFIDIHNGEVWAESIEGEGSSFYFSLPL